MRIYLTYLLICLFTACSAFKAPNKTSDSLKVTFIPAQNQINTAKQTSISQEITPSAQVKAEGTKLIWSQKAVPQASPPSPKK